MLSSRVAALVVSLAFVAACSPRTAPPTPSAVALPPASHRPHESLSPAAPTFGAVPAPVTCADVPTSTPTPGPDPLARPAVPAILGLFDRAPIVAIGEVHGWQAEHDVFGQ